MKTDESGAAQRASTYLGENGPFSECIEGYQVREQQQALCDAVEQMIEDQSVLTAEAGTGIGKTFAYLIPAVYPEKSHRFNRNPSSAGSIIPQRYPPCCRSNGYSDQNSLIKRAQ